MEGDVDTGDIPSGARRPTVLTDALAPRLEDYERLLQVSLRLNSSPDLDDLLSRILESVRELVGAEDASIMLLDRDERTLTFGAIDSPYSESLRNVTLEIGEGVAGWVALHGEPLIVDDAYSDPRFSVKGDVASGHRTANMLCVPLRTPSLVIGTLEVINRHNTQAPLDLSLCLSFANIAAIAIENMRLRQAAERNLARIEEIQRSRIQFFHVLSHELRTPLAVVQMGLSVLKGRTDNSALADETLSSMTANAMRLKRLIQDMFITNDIETLASRLLLRPTRIGDILSALDRRLADEKDVPPKTLSVDVDPSCADIRVLVDREKIGHCLTHLLDNAYKFSHPGGQIRVEARPESATSTVRISVHDDGIGIASDHQERIFEMFYQVDASSTREYGGTGIGLYICRHIVEAHLGQLWCTSVPGKGSTFSFTLPVAPTGAVS